MVTFWMPWFFGLLRVGPRRLALKTKMLLTRQAFIFLVILVFWMDNMPFVPDATWRNPQTLSRFAENGFQFIEIFCGDGHVSQSLRYAGYRTASADIKMGNLAGATRKGKMNCFDLTNAAGFASLGSPLLDLLPCFPLSIAPSALSFLLLS